MAVDIRKVDAINIMDTGVLCGNICDYALDTTGERTLALIEADPFASTPPQPLMSDGDWLRLQAICGG